MNNFKIISYTAKFEAKCPKCGKYIHGEINVPLHVPTAVEKLTKVKTTRFKCYCGHKGFIE